MRVCHVSSEFPPGGGIGHVVHSLGRRLVELGHEVTVYTRGSWSKTKVEYVDGVRVYRLPFQPLPPFHVRLHGIFINRMLKRMEGEFDLVHLHSPLVPQAHSRLPRVVTAHVTWKHESLQHNGQYDPYSVYVRLFHKSFERIEQETFDDADAIVAVSRAVRDQLADYGVKNEDVPVVGNGADTELFKPGSVNRGKTILYVGRLNYRKGMFDLVEGAKHVIKEHPDYSFTLIGEGLLKKTLEKRIAQLGLSDHFSFLGYMPQQKLVEYLQNASVFVFPSYYEGLPQTLIEAMACGLPAVATDVSGNSELVVDGVTGFLVPPKKPLELASAVNMLLDDDGLRARMGRAARKRVEEYFTWDSVARRVLEVYKRF